LQNVINLINNLNKIRGIIKICSWLNRVFQRNHPGSAHFFFVFQHLLLI